MTSIPEPGQTITLTGTVVTAHFDEGNKYYAGDFAQLRLRVDGLDGATGFAFADVRLVVNADTPWFGPQAQKALAALDGEATVAAAERPGRPRKATAKKTSAKALPAGKRVDLGSLSVRELRALAAERDVQVPARASRQKLIELLGR
jgi:hypothetical protein